MNRRGERIIAIVTDINGMQLRDSLFLIRCRSFTLGKGGFDPDYDPDRDFPTFQHSVIFVNSVVQTNP